MLNLAANYKATFAWDYPHGQPECARLYAAAKDGQWDGDKDLPWDTEVDPLSETCALVSTDALPFKDIPTYRSLPPKRQREHQMGFLAWMLSQFLHGEQGALMAACQVTASVPDIDSKLYGSTQIVDEGRHIEVFHRYLTTKLEKLYEINDNLYVIIDSLMHDSRWDMKFLGMQIMVEGLALGAFTTMRHNTEEPLLRKLLKYVITDEARHVHYGVVSLRDYYQSGLSPSEKREREDWAFETTVLLRNRFLAHEFYDEFYGHAMDRKSWDKLVLESDFMQNYRASLFRRLIPNLKRIDLLPNRLRPHYADIGLLQFENEPDASHLTAEDMIGQDSGVN